CQCMMAAHRKLSGLGDGAVVEPDDGVEAIVARRRDTDLRAAAIAHHERTGGVEAYRRDAFRRQAGRRDRIAHRRAGGLPYILGIVLGMVFPRPLHHDRIAGLRQQSPVLIEDAGTGTGRADIDRNDVITHQDEFPAPSGIPSDLLRRRYTARWEECPAGPSMCLRTRCLKSGMASNTASGASS